MHLLTKIGYSDPIAEAKYSLLEKDLLLFSEVQGKLNGTDNKPTTEYEFKAFFLNKVESKIQFHLDENQRLNLPVSGVIIAQKSQNDATQTVKPLESELKDKELELRRLEGRKKEYTPDLRKRRIRRLVYIGAGIIAFTEGVLAYPALRRIPLGWLPSFITALGITIALGVGSHIMAGYIQKSKTRLQFLQRFCTCVIPVCIGFAALGNLRAQAYNTATQMNLNVHASRGGAFQETSGIGITILSILLFLAALMFSVRYHKTEQESHDEAEYDKACDELKTHEKKMREIKAAIENTKGTANIQSAEALRKYEYALAVENRLIGLGRQVVQEYIIKNLCYRTDHITPPFFAEPPELKFKLFFDNVKKKDYENN